MADLMRVKYIQIGELAIAHEPTEFRTVLGSCVSVCVYEPKSRVGGIIHYALPVLLHGHDEASYRYGEVALPQLVVEVLQAAQCSRHALLAKVIGGASQFKEGKVSQVGEQNILLAQSILSALSIPIVSESVGGVKGKKVYFFSHTGEVNIEMLEGLAG